MGETTAGPRQMTAAKLKLDSLYDECVRRSLDHTAIVRRLFLHDLPRVFETHSAAGFELFDDLRRAFDVPFTSIKATGSAQLGYSYFQSRDFAPATSDLDVAIIDARMFQQYSEECFLRTSRYTSNTLFTGTAKLNGTQQLDSFLDYLSKGCVRPELMPQIPLKSYVLETAGKVHKKFNGDFNFSKITIAIYMSELFFTMKQNAVVDRIKGKK